MTSSERAQEITLASSIDARDEAGLSVIHSTNRRENVVAQLGTRRDGKPPLSWAIKALACQLWLEGHTHRAIALEIGQTPVAVESWANRYKWGKLAKAAGLTRNRPTVDIHESVIAIRDKIERGDLALASMFVPDFAQAAEDFKDWRMNAVQGLTQRFDELQAQDTPETQVNEETGEEEPMDPRAQLEFDAKLAKSIAAIGKDAFGAVGATGGGGKQNIAIFLDIDV
jgi:hypothetical protein